MVKLFRNIRKKLVAEGKTANYLKYAIGEIFLVVIGILLALEVNNWNEQRKARVQEIRQLKNIQEDILLDKKDVIWNIEAHNLFLTSEIELLNYMMGEDLKPKKPIAYENALGSPIILTLHESSFSNLKNNDINIITNEKLKKQIASYFDNFAKVMLKVENDLDEYKTYSVIKPYFIKYFQYANESNVVGHFETDSDDYFSPKLKFNKYILADTLGLKKDEAFKIILAESISSTSNKLDIYEDFLKRIQDLNESINKELKRIE